MLAPMDPVEIEEIFAGLGPVSVRRMFGGQGVYHQGLILAVVVDGELLLKADGESAPAFEAAGARRWTYDGQPGRVVEMPYWSIPDAAWDDPEEMTRWVRLAWEAAVRAGAARAQAFAAGTTRTRPPRPSRS
jgi:DNA transformation protein and related proteins